MLIFFLIVFEGLYLTHLIFFWQSVLLVILNIHLNAISTVSIIFTQKLADIVEKVFHQKSKIKVSNPENPAYGRQSIS